MLSSITASILVVSIGFFGFRSYRKGIWHAGLSLLGLICAYGVSFFAGPLLLSAIAPSASQQYLLFGGLMVGLFLLISTLFTWLPVKIWPLLMAVSPRQKLAGAGLGAVVGMIVGLLIIWIYTTAWSLMAPQKAMTMLDSDLIARAASGAVSGAVSKGLQVADADPFQASATAALVAEPYVFSQAMEQIAESSVLRDLWMDGKAQFLMAEGDVAALSQESKFRAFVEAPAMKQLILSSKPQQVSEAEAELYVAQQMSFVWRRMRTLRSDQRVVALLEDPEIKTLVDKQNPLALLSNDKVQQLIAIVMEPAGEARAADVEVPPEQSQQNPSEALQPGPNILYRWRDSSGKTRYTDAQSTPEDKRATAQRIEY